MFIAVSTGTRPYVTLRNMLVFTVKNW